MAGDSLDRLRAVMSLMREMGATILEWEGAKIVLGSEPTPRSRAVNAMRAVQELVAEQQGASPGVQELRDGEHAGRELTDEEILFASSRGVPAEAALGVR